MRPVAAVLLAVLSVVSINAAPVTPRRVEARETLPGDARLKVRDGRHLLLPGAIFDPVNERPDFQAAGFPRVNNAASEYAIVQLRPAQPGAKAELERLGVKFFGYLSENGYQVRLSPAARKAVSAHASVRWVGDYEPGFKVHPRLWPARADKVRNIRVVPFPDSSVKKTVALLKRGMPDLVITKTFDGGYAHFVEISVPAGQVDDFVRKAAAVDGVSWIEPNDQMKFHNSSSSGAIQGNKPGTEGHSIFAHGITGTGQIIAVADSGLDSDMCYFRGLNGRDAVTEAAVAGTEEPGPLHPLNKVIGYWVQPGADAYDSSGAGFHGTHTSGSVAGDNIAHPSSGTDAGLDLGDGMAPNAQLIFQDIGRNDEAGTLTGGDPYVMFTQALRGGARVHSNSYGSSTNGAYTAYDQIVDQFLFDHDAMTVVFSAGNDGPLVSTTGSPANAKNVISVGATRGGTSPTSAAFSSRGPTADGRIKPDIVGPGMDIQSAKGDMEHGNGNCVTASQQGTSMSAPTVAGGAALLRQYFTDGYYPTGSKKEADRVNPSATLVKAVLLNGALPLPAGEKYGDFKFGWGKIFLDNNLYFPGDARKLRVWDLPNFQGLSTGESASYNVSVAAGQEVRFTLVWTDPEGTLGAAKSLVNDLDLTVTNGAETFRGNVFGTTGDSATGGVEDRLNNVEQVRFVAPVGGTYTVTVNAAAAPGNGRSGTDRQGFALAVSAAHCSTGVAAVPQGLLATTNSVRGADLTWSPIAGATSVQVYRATGTNPALADFRYIGSSNGTSFTDRRAQGGYAYTYMVRGADSCGEGPSSTAVTFTATGLCDIAPAFDGLASADADGTFCRINLSWGAAQSNCPLGTSLKYNVYRSTAHDFVPSGEPYATTTGTSFSDNGVESGTTYYYVVRAEDSTNASGGPNGGNQETNVARLFATAFGAPGATGIWRDGGGDGGAFLTPDVAWEISTRQAKSGSRSYHNGPEFDNYADNTCASLVTPAITLDANAELSYFARYNLEYQWDGVIVEISVDGGATWSDLPPAGGYPSTLAETQGDDGTDPAVNACGYPLTASAFTGPEDNEDLTAWTEYRSSLAAHAGKTVRIRWRFTSDPGLEYEGFYLDDVSISNAKLPGACTPLVQSPAAAFELSPGRPSPGSAVSFHDLSLHAPTSWFWNFGDGGTSTQQHPTHTYASAGTYTVTLTATNAQGSAQATRSVKVEEPGEGSSKRRAVRTH